MSLTVRSAFALASALALSALTFLPACDVVDQPIPPTEVVQVRESQRRLLDSLEAARGQLAAAPVQRVLLEDYTGHQCGNCPRAARKATELQGQYGDKVVVVATHVGYFARTNATGAYSYDFKTPAGDELDQTFHVSDFGLPQGMVDRTAPTGAGQPVTTETNWGTLVADHLSRPAEQQITLTPVLRADSGTLLLKVRVKYLTDQPSRSFRLVVNVLEDSVHNWQKDYSITDPANPGKDIADYVHRHVLRAAPLSTFGISSATSPAARHEMRAYLAYPLSTAWVPRHCRVVAYLIDDATRRITQVAEADVAGGE